MSSREGGSEMSDEIQRVAHMPDRDQDRVGEAGGEQRKICNAQKLHQRDDLEPGRAQPDQDDRMRHDGEKCKDGPLHGAQKRNRIEVDLAEICSCPGFRQRSPA